MYLYGNEEKMENEASDKKKDIKRGDCCLQDNGDIRQ